MSKVDCKQSYFFLRSRAQSDGKIMQIRKVCEGVLGRGGACASRGSLLHYSLDPSHATELRKRKRLLAVYVESKLCWLCFNSCCNCLIKNESISQSMRNKTKTNRNLVVPFSRAFRRLHVLLV